MLNRRSIVLSLGAALLAGTARAQDLPIIGDVLGIGGSDAFRQTDLMGGSFATATSQLALERSRTRAIRRFAHAEIAEQNKVALALGATPGAAPVRADQAGMIAQLEAADRGSFDAQYVLGQLMGHRELLALNTSYLRAGSNPVDRGVANMSLPIIRRHLAILHHLHREA